MCGQDAGSGLQSGVLQPCVLVSNDVVLHTGLIQSSQVTLDTVAGVVGQQGLELHDGDVDGVGAVLLQNDLGSFLAHQVAVGVVIGGVTGNDEVSVGQVDVGQSNLHTLLVCSSQSSNGSVAVQGSDGQALNALCQVSIDQLGFLSLVIVGVVGQDLDTGIIGGVNIALGQHVHELVVLEHDARNSDLITASFGSGLGGLVAAGSQAKNHDQSQQQSDILFHLFFLLSSSFLYKWRAPYVPLGKRWT